MNDTVTIPRSVFKSLANDAQFLIELEVGGVDNWVGYDYAREAYRESRDNLFDAYTKEYSL